MADLPPTVFKALDLRGIGPTVIVATTDPDGSPHTAPFGSMCAITTRVLRFACDRRHDTFSNINRDNRVTISVIAPPDIAVSIRGRARVLKEKMSVTETDAVVEVEVEDVKNDFIPGSRIKTGTTYSVSDNLVPLVKKYLAEVREAH